MSSECLFSVFEHLSLLDLTDRKSFVRVCVQFRDVSRVWFSNKRNEVFAAVAAGRGLPRASIMGENISFPSLKAFDEKHVGTPIWQHPATCHWNAQCVKCLRIVPHFETADVGVFSSFDNDYLRIDPVLFNRVKLCVTCQKELGNAMFSFVRELFGISEEEYGEMEYEDFGLARHRERTTELQSFAAMQTRAEWCREYMKRHGFKFTAIEVIDLC